MVAVHAIVASPIVTCSTNAVETLSVSAWHYKKQKDDRPATRMVAEPKATYGSKRTPIAQPTRPASGSTYRPAYVPPTPSASAPAKKPKIKVDLSKVHAGTIVRHKGYGLGQVKGIDGAIIVVTFDGVDKKFQFPGGFENGFLFLTEDE